MKRTFVVMAMLLMLATSAQASPIDWQAELDHCRALREQVTPLLLAGKDISLIARSGTALRRCIWTERRALRHGAR
jgi:hypothetical protein